MSKKVKKSGTNINDIYIGEVALVKTYNEQEKVPTNQNYVGMSGNTSVNSISIRGIVFTMKNGKCVGTELSRIPKNSKYDYRVITNESDLTGVKNNTLVIENPKKVGALLACTGFPAVVKGNNITQVRKLLLSNEQVLTVRKHTRKLSAPIFDVQLIEEANKQASDLYWFKNSKLPTKPQEIEKVYKKHFK